MLLYLFIYCYYYYYYYHCHYYRFFVKPVHFLLSSHLSFSPLPSPFSSLPSLLFSSLLFSLTVVLLCC